MIQHLSPEQSWHLLQNNVNAVLIDVRTKMEHLFVGHPIGAIHIAWKETPDWQLNPDFFAMVKQTVPDTSTPILLLCRSGQRSVEAANLLEVNGYQHLINIVDGFEGPLDNNKQRGHLGGWRYCDLPWQQS